MKGNSKYQKIASRCIWLLVVCFAMILPSESWTQTVSAVECSCLNNATTANDGQFEEIITINGTPGQTWKVKHVTGLFSFASPAPPASPIQVAVGTIVTEVSPGVYMLRAKRRDRTSWNVVFNNGIIDLPINATRRCTYPSSKMQGDKGLCINKTKKYSVDVAANLVNTISWSVSGNGSIVGANNLPEVNIRSNGTAGIIIVTATGTARSFVGQSTGFCNINIRDTIRVVNDLTPISLACKNSINVTLFGDCSVEITPDLVLEDIKLPLHHYTVVLRDPATGQILPSNKVDGSYINKRLEVSIYHECSGNFCWGTILFEDKAIPPLVCPPRDTVDCDEIDKPEFSGLPLPSTAFWTLIGPRRYRVVDYDFCSDVTLTFTDEQISTSCTGMISAIIRRTWVATDANGNITKCDQEIAVKKATLMNITWPDNYDDVLGPNPSISSCATWTKLPNGHPSPDFTGRPRGQMCSNISVSFEDTRFDICKNDKTFKIRRVWKVIDHCTGDFRTHTQTITVMDNTPPTCSVPANITVSANDQSCAGVINVPIPNVTDCIDWDYSIAYKPVDDSNDPYTGSIVDGVIQASNGQYVIQGISENHTRYWISYYINDGCGNRSRCFTTVLIKDDKDPVAICKQFTFVSLNESGMAWAGPDAFDNGSYDNCALAKMEVRRMEDTICGMVSAWSDKVIFCCRDVGKTVMVSLRVTDKSGNSNTCMVEVQVQDNIPPRFVFCPRDTTVDCGTDLSGSLIRFGTPIVVDSCGARVTESVSRANGECSTSTVTRTFTARDSSGNMSTCSQRISVRILNPFGLSDITWPKDTILENGCRNLEVNPESLALAYRYPRFGTKLCAKAGYDYKDIVFQYADGACFKILREWTVIDWCQFEPRAFNPIKWTHTQVIKVQNNVPPTITKGCNAGDLIVEDGGAPCRSRMRLTAQGTDDCGGFVYFEYELDLDNNGTIDFKDHSSVIDKVVSYGNHRVVWFARDECGNVTRCERVFRVDDVKKPTPICHSQIVSVVMPSAKMITLWAKDFIKEGLDNCSPPTALKYSFTSNRRDSSKIFTCQDFVDNKVSGVPVRIYVFDTVGNSDYCDARLLLQDNSNVCTGTTAGAKLTVEGQIFDADQKPIEGVKVSILSTQPNFPVHMNTNKNGNYFFGDLKSGENYQWGAYKDEDANEGVNTLDIVAIQRHILAVSRFTNSSKLLAADVNKDQKITVGDIVQLRKLVLGVIDHFDSESWSFVATDQMPTMDDLYPVKSSFEISPMTKSEKNKNFTGIKLGDIDFSYNQTKLNGRSVMPMVMTKLPSQANARYGLKLEHISGLSGVQFDLKGNDLSRITEITFDNSKIDLAYHKVNDDITRVVILPNQGRVSIDQCELIITTKDDAELDVQLDKGYAFAAEGQEIITYDLALRNYRINTNGELIVYQNTPNPFEEHTEIAFEIPKDDDVTIKVFNNEGRIIYQTKSFYNKGIHKLKLSGQELDAKGLLYYQILTKTHYAGRRMIKLN